MKRVALKSGPAWNLHSPSPVVEKLIANGANVDQRDVVELRSFHIHRCSRTGPPSIVELLLNAGANVNCKSDDGQTPLMLACCVNKYDIAQLLLERGAGMDYQTNHGFTALHCAAVGGDVALVELLLQHGGDPNCGDKVKPLCLAARDRKVDTCRTLLKAGADVNGVDPEEGATPLHAAAHIGSEDVVQLLLEHGATVSSRINESLGAITPLYVAAFKGFTRVCNILVDAGADVNAQDSTGQTPLCVAVDQQHIDAVKYLVRCGANVNHSANSGRTPLYTAVFVENLDVCRVLLEHGADTAHCTDEGHTALTQAVIDENVDVVKLLLEYGVSQVNEPKHCCKPIEHAAASGNLEICRLLLSAGANLSCSLEQEKIVPVLFAATRGHLQVVKLLVEAGPPELVNEVDLRDTAPMHTASFHGFEDIVRFLVINGASLVNRDIHDMKPLQFAVMNSHVGIAEFLIAAGAPMGFDEFGVSPLTEALNRNVSSDMLHLLLQRNSEYCALGNAVGNTALLFLSSPRFGSSLDVPL